MSRALLTPVLAALALRLGVAIASPVQPTSDGAFYERAASQIARGEGYTHPYAWGAGSRPGRHGAPHATAFYPIGWPAVLGSWRAAGVPRAWDPLLPCVLGALTSLLAGLIAFRVAEQASGERSSPNRQRAAGERAGAASAWAVALWPSGVLTASSWMGEPLFTLALLAAIAPLALARARWAAIVLSAVLFGVAAYVRPTALAIAPLALAGYAYASFDRKKVLWAAGAAIGGTALALVVLSPWMARNAEHVGAPVIATNAGANLLVGTVSPIFVHIPDELDCPPSRELARDVCRRERAIERIEADPLAWAALAPLKLFHTFAYEGSCAVHYGASVGLAHPSRHPLVWALGALCTTFWLALLALGLRGQREVRMRLVVLAPFVAVALVHVIFLGGDRYHEPLVPLLAILASPVLARVELRRVAVESQRA
jgi:hypothetical protein